MYKLRQTFFDIAIIILITGLLLITLEFLAWRTLKYFSSKRQNYETSHRFFEKPPLFVPKVINGSTVLYSKNFPTRYYSNLSDTRGRSLSPLKSNKFFRIFTFGGSSVAGAPFGHWASFSRIIEDTLSSIKKENTKIEVINFGVSGFGSLRIKELAKESLKYKPDLIILYMGHNEQCDYVNLFNLRKRETPKRFNILKSLNLFKLILYLKGFVSPVQWPQEPFYINQCKARRMLYEDERDLLSKQFFKHITEITTFARTAGAQVVLLSQFSNELMPPYTPNNQGVTKNIEDSKNATLLYFKATRAFFNKHYSVARKLFLGAIEFDSIVRRYRPSYSKILKTIANTYSGVHYVDIQTKVSNLLPNGIIDGRLVVDTMHPNLTGQLLIAKFLLEDFFLKEQPRQDLFKYQSLNVKNIWSTKFEFSSYTLICQRYYGLKNWSSCLQKVRKHLENSEHSIERQRRLRFWEFLLIDGILHKNCQTLKESYKLFPAPWFKWSQATNFCSF